MYFLQTYAKKNGFIITQYPSQDQVVEFIRLMVDYECCTVICMDPLHNINSVGAFLILPSRVHNNWLYQLFIYCLLLMTWFSPNCSLYFPTYCKNTIHVTLFYKAVVSILQKLKLWKKKNFNSIKFIKSDCQAKIINLFNRYETICALFVNNLMLVVEIDAI